MKMMMIGMLNLLISSAWANKPVTEIKCDITAKLFQTEFNKVTERPTSTAQTLWDKTLRVPLRRARAYELAENLKYLENRFLKRLKRKAKQSIRKNIAYDIGKDDKLDKLQMKIDTAQKKYNNYIIKNLRSSFAKKVKTVHENGAYFNFAHNDDQDIEFKSTLFTEDLDIEKNKELNLEFFDRKDINGSLYHISYNKRDPKIIEISKNEEDESVALSELVTNTLSDGHYHSVKTVYQYKLGKKRPAIQYIINKYKSEDSMDNGDLPSDQKVLNQEQLLNFVNTANCENGYAKNEIPKIVNDSNRDESKLEGTESGSATKNTSKEITKD